MDESGEEGVVREVKEETGLDVTCARYLFSIPNLYEYSGMGIHTLDMFYLCKVANTTSLQAMDDAEEALWIPLSAVNPDAFGLCSIRQAVGLFVKKTQTFPI
jgi:ADP-ribose pyrophosphatase YjhB (NUDIX family)